MTYNVIDDMTPGEITASLTPSGTPGDTLWTNAYSGMDTDGTTHMHWPQGLFTMTGPITINKTMTLSGEKGKTIFWFPLDSAGLVIDTLAPGTVLDGVALTSVDGGGIAQGTTSTAHGIDVDTTCKLRDVAVSFFGGNGINITAQDPVNANSWKITDCASNRNGGDGLYLQGNNSNAGVCIGLDTSVNGGNGIYEHSFLGNTYIGCHSSTNGVRYGRCEHDGNRYWAGLAIGQDTTVEPAPSMTSWTDPWKLKGAGASSVEWPEWVSTQDWRYCTNYYSDSGETSPADRTLTLVQSWCAWIGCYSELGVAPNYFPPSHSVINGDMGGWVAAGRGGYETADEKFEGQDYRALREEGEVTEDLCRVAKYNSNPLFHTIIDFIHRSQDASYDDLSVAFTEDDATYPSNFLFRTDSDSAKTAFGVVGEQGFAAGGFGRAKVDIPLASLFLPRGVYVGDPAAGGRWEGAQATKPDWVGTHGDYCRNTAPVLGGNSGWTCLSDGSWVVDGLVGQVTNAAKFESGPDSYGNLQ